MFGIEYTKTNKLQRGNEEMKIYRICSNCKCKMSQGFVVDSHEYYCTDECLGSRYTVKEYEEMYENDIAYWTEWEE